VAAVSAPTHFSSGWVSSAGAQPIAESDPFDERAAGDADERSPAMPMRTRTPAPPHLSCSSSAAVALHRARCDAKAANTAAGEAESSKVGAGPRQPGRCMHALHCLLNAG
jgi:hypothetical protein